MEYAPTALIGTWPLLTPGHPELVAAHMLRPLCEAATSGSGHRREAAPLALTWLAEPGTPLGPVAHAVLALGPAAAAPEVRALAGDVLIQAAEEGRLDPSLLATGLEHAAAGLLKVALLTETLRAATAPSTPAFRALQALWTALPVLASHRDVHRLITSTADLVVRFGAPGPFPEELEALADRGGRTKAALEAKRLRDVLSTVPKCPTD